MAWTSFGVSNVCEALKTQKNPRHAPCLQKSNRTAVELIRASISLRKNLSEKDGLPVKPGNDGQKTWTSPAMTG